MSVRLPAIERISTDIASLLTARGFHRESIRIERCFGYRYCDSPYCIKCISRRVLKEREHLQIALPALLREAPRYELWIMTATTDDSSNLTAHAEGAVQGVRRLMRDRRLQSRVIDHFSVLEVSSKPYRSHPCSHVHSLVVTKPITVGKYTISEPDWIRMWEESCPLARRRDLNVPLTRKGKQRKRNVSFLAEQVPRTEDDLARVMHYVTKWATVHNVCRDYRQMLANHDDFIERIRSLIGVTRFFGGLHRSQTRNQQKDGAVPERTHPDFVDLNPKLMPPSTVLYSPELVG